jgi:two-component system, NarL family, response regulator LiaR
MQSVWKNVLLEQPEVALLDWSTASRDIQTTRALLQSDRHPTSIIFLTASEDSRQKRVMLRLGAEAVLAKTCSAEELRATILKACRQLLPDTSNPGKSRTLKRAAACSQDPAVRIRQLTRRERQLIPLVSSGLKNKEIAQALGISESTVWHHLTAIFTKLQVEDRLGLAAFAFSHGLARSGGPAPQDVSRTAERFSADLKGTLYQGTTLVVP